MALQKIYLVQHIDTDSFCLVYLVEPKLHVEMLIVQIIGYSANKQSLILQGYCVVTLTRILMARFIYRKLTGQY